jgi:hypothetical protein
MLSQNFRMGVMRDVRFRTSFMPYLPQCVRRHAQYCLLTRVVRF